MYQNMNQDAVIHCVGVETQRAAMLIGADSFYIVIYDTIYGNADDEVSWFHSTTGLNPQDGRVPSLKRADKASIYSIATILRLIAYIVKHTYVALGNSVHRQIRGIPQGGNSSGHMANLTCHTYERIFVETHPEHPIQHCIFRYMDDFDVNNAPYFMQMYQENNPPESGIGLIPNRVALPLDHLLECRFLDIFTYKDLRAFAWPGDAKKLSSNDSFGKNVAKYSKLGQNERLLLHWVGLGIPFRPTKTYFGRVGSRKIPGIYSDHKNDP
jgi:hypothetical protein